MTVRADDGSKFWADSLDLGAEPLGSHGANMVRVDGYLNGTLVHSLMRDLLLPEQFQPVNIADLGVVDTMTITGIGLFPSRGEFVVDNVSIHRVPEPMTLSLVAIGAGLLWRRQRRYETPKQRP